MSAIVVFFLLPRLVLYITVYRSIVAFISTFVTNIHRLREYVLSCPTLSPSNSLITLKHQHCLAYPSNVSNNISYSRSASIYSAGQGRQFHDPNNRNFESANNVCLDAQEIARGSSNAWSDLDNAVGLRHQFTVSSFSFFLEYTRSSQCELFASYNQGG